MTNKLVVIMNTLKVPKIKKILLYEMKFLVPNYSCLQNPWLRGYRPQIAVLSVLCPQLNLLSPPPRTKFLSTPLCTMGTGSIPGVKFGRGVTLTPHPLLVPWSRKNRAIPVLPLWAVRPVQGYILPFKVIKLCTIRRLSKLTYWISPTIRCFYRK